MRLRMVGLMLVAVVSAAHAAHADEPPLIVRHARGAEECPNADEIRVKIASRLRRDPFSNRSGSITITFERVDDGFLARLSVADAERTIGPSRRCSTTSRALVLALSVMLSEPAPAPAPAPAPDSVSVPDPAPVPVPVPETPTPDTPKSRSPDPPTPRAPGFAAADDASDDTAAAAADLDDELAPLGPRPPPASVTLRSSPRPPLTTRLAFGAGISAGLLPGPTSTRLGWEMSFRRGAYSALIATYVDLGQDYEIAGGSVSTQLLAGTAGFCVHGPLLVGCLLASGGALLSDGDGFSTPADPTTAYAAGGMRIGLEIPLIRGSLFAKVHVDLLGTLIRSRLQVEGTPGGAWTAPGGSMSAGVSVQARLW